MKIERLSENKIKILIDPLDIKVWDVDLKNFTDNTPEAQDMFWYALRLAERELDFVVGKAQLLVETMPLEDSGFVMIISKLEDGETVAAAFLRSGRSIKQAYYKKMTEGNSLLRIFGFEDFENLVDGVSEIAAVYVGESRLFKFQSGYYLELLPRDSFGLFELENILMEFSRKVENPLSISGVLNEHGLLMIGEDAVAVIDENFH